LQYNFEWDPTKAKANYRKHKVSFERAAEIFRDLFMLSIFDKEHSQVEDRYAQFQHPHHLSSEGD
jgi:uncharacterized DUF497 family protein